jgi:hypothetical protein
MMRSRSHTFARSGSEIPRHRNKQQKKGSQPDRRIMAFTRKITELRRINAFYGLQFKRNPWMGLYQQAAHSGGRGLSFG